MRYVRRLIAILTGCATWFLVAATAAYAQVPPDPVGGGGGDSNPTTLNDRRRNAGVADRRLGDSRDSPGPCRRGPVLLALATAVGAVPDIGAVEEAARVAHLTCARSGGHEAPAAHVRLWLRVRMVGSTTACRRWHRSRRGIGHLRVAPVTG